MTVTLARCIDDAGVIKYGSCPECWDETTEQHGIYTGGTFYPRCWNGSDWVVEDLADGTCNRRYGSCCKGQGLEPPQGCTHMPVYLKLTIWDVASCVRTCTGGTFNTNEANGTFILEWAQFCRWTTYFPVGTCSGQARWNVYMSEGDYCDPNEGAWGYCPTGQISVHVWGLIGGAHFFHGSAQCITRSSCYPCGDLPQTTAYQNAHALAVCKVMKCDTYGGGIGSHALGGYAKVEIYD